MRSITREPHAAHDTELTFWRRSHDISQGIVSRRDGHFIYWALIAGPLRHSGAASQPGPASSIASDDYDDPGHGSGSAETFK